MNTRTQTKKIEFVFESKTPEQLKVMECLTPNLLHDGCWFAGKTHVGAAKALFLGLRYPNNCIALVRKKRVDLKATLWKWFVDKVLPPEIVIAHNDTELYRKISNGTEFHGVGLDSDKDVNKLASREYGFIVVEEARETSESDFDEKISRCLRLPTVPFHQLLLLTNPEAPSHYLYKRFILNKLKGYERIKASMLPNPPATYQQRLDQLTGIYKLRYVDGEWAAFEGLVYPFDPTKHLISRFPIPIDWQRILIIDFGFDNPFVAAWYAISPSDVWYLYREIYMTHRTVNKHAPDIKAYCIADGMEPIAICDHDAEDCATLREHGIMTITAQKDRMTGQQAVYDLFDEDRVYFFDDSLVELDQRLVMAKKPTRTVEEFSGYIWANKAKEDMIKVNDHGMDTLRYGVYTMRRGISFDFGFEAVTLSADQALASMGIR